jgi:hypothetical protein
MMIIASCLIITPLHLPLLHTGQHRGMNNQHLLKEHLDRILQIRDNFSHKFRADGAIDGPMVEASGPARILDDREASLAILHDSIGDAADC